MDAVQQMRKEVKKYIDTADPKIIRMMHAMLEADQENDWWNDLDEDARTSIKQGLKDVREGKVTPHKIAMKKYSKWLSK